MELNKKILIIGNTGFIGSWLTFYLKYKGYQNIYGISIDKGSSNLQKIATKNKILKKQFKFNALDFNKLEKTIDVIKPKVIYQLAALSLVDQGLKKPFNSFKNNFNLSLNICEIFTKKKYCNILINFSSDKCYEPSKKQISENHALGGKEPYSLSKAASEMILKGYKNLFIKNNKVVINIRAGNVIGGGDININRIIPDLNSKVFSKKKKLILTNPNSKRPWLFNFDLLNVLLFLQKKNLNSGLYNFNIGSNNNTSVKKLVKKYLDVNSLSLNISKSKIPKFENEVILLKNTNLNKIIKINFTSLDTSLKYIYEWEKNYIEDKSDIFNFIKFQFKKFNMSMKSL